MRLGAPLEGQGNPLNNVSLEVLGTAPTAGLYAGRTYYDTTLRTERTYNGTAWTNKDGTSTPLQQIAAPTGAVSLNGQKITSLATPTANTDAATKAYIDGLIAGIGTGSGAMHTPVRVTDTGGYYDINAPGTTMDGVTLANGDRILLRSQLAGAENGIWVFNGATSALTRPADWTGTVPRSGDTVIVAEGTTYDNQLFILATNGAITVGTTAVAFVQGGSSGITRTSLGATGKYATTVGDGTTTSFTITHGLSSTDVVVKTYTTNATDVPTDELLASVTVVDANTVTVVSSSPVPAASGNAGRLRVVVVG